MKIFGFTDFPDTVSVIFRLVKRKLKEVSEYGAKTGMARHSPTLNHSHPHPATGFGAGWGHFPARVSVR